MKKFVFSFVVLFTLGSLAVTDVLAQTVKVKREAMSPGRRSSGTPNYTAPPGPNYISTGLRTVAKGMMVYLSADTTGSIGSFSWSFVSRPTGSTAVIDTPGNKFVRFIPDVFGQYIVKVTANGSLNAYDTLWVSTYAGVGVDPPGCGTVGACHADKRTEWSGTGHSRHFTEGITGQLEVSTSGMGYYAPGCIKCHTTGWEPTVNNGNFGYIAHQTTWDSTWWRGLTGNFLIPYNDSTIYRNMPASLLPVANIGCESCHGPGANHFGDAKKIGVSKEAGVCMQCHDAPKKHRLGTYWQASGHSTFAEGGHTSNTSCFPCHSGSAFPKWINNKSAPGYSVAADGNININCITCHDPHSDANPNQLRTVTIDSLKNGWKPAAGIGGKGLLCMNCHQSRYVQKVKSTPPYYGFGSRFNPHGNPQADMFFGRNSYEFGDANLAGLSTHTGLANACVTCHMATRVNGTSSHSDHELAMKDGDADFVVACVGCHGPITTFDAIRAPYDYDHNGLIEGVQTEVQGMLNQLKLRLPLASNGEPIGGSIVTRADSNLIANRPDLVAGIYTYYFVKNDKSMGVHNTKYAVAILQKALGWYPTDVKLSDNTVPKEFALNQNYPNPFNPTTTISFALPTKDVVRLEVYDMLGKLVSTIVDGKELNAGTYNVTWDGTDRNGTRASSGVYLYRIQTSSFSSVKKMMMLK